uniref:Uncharacterized protein n=1 Tax=Equus asinus TaxID=9793 RepID=A0A9L0IX37_EQUAS
MMTVAAHELGKEAVLLGETAEAPGFKLKPAESQPMGMCQDEEFWNTYQCQQEYLSKNSHKETEPVCKRGAHLCGSANATMLAITVPLPDGSRID